MLPLAAVTVIVVFAGDGEAGAASPAVERALRDSLGESTVVVVRAGAGESDESLLRQATADHAALLGVVSWSEAPKRAVIHFVRPTDGARWSDREIRFDPTDAPPERGRTVGFALASMVPDEALARARAEAKPAPAPLVATPPILAPSLPTTPAERPSTEHELRAPGKTMLEIVALGATSIDGDGGGLGGALAVRLALGGPLQLRFSGGARVGEIAIAQATARHYFLGAGLAWQPWLDASRRWAAGARLDALLLGQEVVHFSEDDAAPAHRFRLLPGLSTAFEGTWRFTDQAAIVAALGAEASFGHTDVVLDGVKVAEVVPLHPFAEAGFRVSF